MSATDRHTLDEFDVIKRCFRPLAEKEPGAFALKDDAAVLPAQSGYDLVMTMDTAVAGVHFLLNDPPGSVAAKVLGVNLSDLAAMGAAPYVYTLSVALNRDEEISWLESFANALKHEQETHGISLVGGDTVRTPGPTSLTINATGLVPSGEALKRSGANVGDSIYVSGVIGEGALGLLALQGELSGIDEDVASRCIDKYRFPKPRLSLGKRLRGIATAAIDISDGLLQDLGHICETSGVGAKLELSQIPLPTRANSTLVHKALNGGDDYELVFTTSESDDRVVQQAIKGCDVECQRIGTIVEGAAVMVYDNGDALKDMTVSAGYNHFSS